jgi:hypothetical protein
MRRAAIVVTMLVAGAAACSQSRRRASCSPRIRRGAIYFRLDGSYADIVVLDTNPPVIAETAANVRAAAEALDGLAILALQEGQPVGAMCHGGTVAGMFP